MSSFITTAKQLGAAIRQTRRDAGLTQQELAVRARVSRRWLGMVESGKAPRAELGLVLRVLSTLGVGLNLVQKPQLTGEEARAAQYLGIL